MWLYDITVGPGRPRRRYRIVHSGVGGQLAGVRGDVVAIGPKHLQADMDRAGRTSPVAQGRLGTTSAVLENGEASRTLITLAVTRGR